MKNKNTQPELTLKDMLEQLSTDVFIKMFLHIKYGSKKAKWYPHPEQTKMLDAYDHAMSHKGSTFWLLKSRQAAGTSMVAARLIKKCLALNDYEVLVMSKSGDQAVKFLDKRVLVTLKWLYEYFPEIPWPSYKTRLNKITFSNGASIEAINSSLHAGRGDTVDEVVLDEAAAGEFRYHFDEIWGSITGGTEHSATGNKTVLSTAEPGTTFNSKSKEFYQEPKPNIFFYFMGRYAIPEEMRGVEWWQQRVAELGPVRATLEYPITVADCFVTNEGYVFPQLEKPEGRHVYSMPINKGLVYGTTYDHGRTKEHPAVIWYWQFDKYKDHLHIFKERFWFEPQGGVPEICADINIDLLANRSLGLIKPTRNIADTAITNDDGRQSIRDIIHDKTKIYYNSAHKYDEKASLDFLITRINEDRISFDPSCKHSIRQYSDLRWSMKTDRYGKADDLDNDSVDVGRYCDADLRKVYPKKEEKLLPPRYTRARKIWVDKHSIKAVGVPQTHDRDWTSDF